MSFQFTDNSDEILREFNEAVERSLEAIGLQAEAHAKLELENDPRRIDTGLLRNSITHALAGEAPSKTTYSSDDGSKTGSYGGTAPDDGKGDSVYIGTNVEYAVYVHEGTRKMRPNRFLKNAVMNNVDEYKRIAEQYMKNT